MYINSIAMPWRERETSFVHIFVSFLHAAHASHSIDMDSSRPPSSVVELSSGNRGFIKNVLFVRVTAPIIHFQAGTPKAGRC